MSLFEANIGVLSAIHPRAAEAVGKASAAAANIEVLSTPSGAPTARQDGIYLHGKHDPARDAAAQVTHEIDAACTAVIVVGFGLGYGAEAARKAFPSRPLLVVEPDADMFRAALTCRDLRGFLEDPAVHLHVGAQPEELPAVLESLPLARPGFLRLRPAVRARPGTYRASEETIQSWLLRRDINVNTLHRFGRLWVRNLCRNMGEFLRCPGVASLHGIFEGLPALVVAGGPSLDEIAPRLAELRERMLVVAVNTPVRACRERGVEPDFTIVVDPQYWASRSLDWTPAINGVLVAEPSTCPRVFRREEERFFLCSSLFPLGETLEVTVGEKGKLGAGGSVATSAWDLARLLGARPLYAAGLDLGFPGMRTHCRGAYTEVLWLSAANRFSPLEGSSFRSVRDIGLFTARSAGGGSTPTDRRMLLYKWWFENQLRIHPNLPSYTLSAEGIAIEGMPRVPLEDMRALPIVRPEIDRRMAKVRQLHDAQAGSVETRERLIGAIGELGTQLAQLEALAERGRARSRDLGLLLAGHRIAEGGFSIAKGGFRIAKGGFSDTKGGFRIAKGGFSDTEACITDMDEIDRGILAISARSIAGFLIQSVIHGITGEGTLETDPKEVVTRSEAMYAGIADSAAWQRELLERASERLERFR